MGRKGIVGIVTFVGLLIIFGGYLVLKDRPFLEKSKPEGSFSSTLKIKGKSLIVELADTPEKRAVGLSGRDRIPSDSGMLFVFEEPGLHSFWMKDMRFPVDIVWIDKNYRVVDIKKNVPPDSFPKTFAPKEPSQYVLEVNAGFVDRYNIKIGDVVDFSDIFPKRKPQELLFVEDAENNEVIVLNLDGEVVKRIKVGKEPHDIVISPDKEWVVTGNFGEGTVSFINTRTLSLEGSISTGEGAHGVAFSPDGKFLFVANAKESTLSVIDMTSWSQGMIKQAKIKIGEIPEYVGLTKDGSKVFTTNLAGRGSITILENRGLKSKIIKTVDLGVDPHGWAVSPDGSKVVITNLGSDITYILDSETFEEIGHIDTGATTEFAAFKNSEELWVTDIGAHYISIIDVNKNEFLEKIEVGETPHGISFSSDRTLTFVPLYGPGEIVIIDAVRKEVVKRIKVGGKLHNSVVVRIG